MKRFIKDSFFFFIFGMKTYRQTGGQLFFTLKNYISDSFRIERNMIMIMVVLLIINPTKFRLVHHQKEISVWYESEIYFSECGGNISLFRLSIFQAKGQPDCKNNHKVTTPNSIFL